MCKSVKDKKNNMIFLNYEQRIRLELYVIIFIVWITGIFKDGAFVCSLRGAYND